MQPATMSGSVKRSWSGESSRAGALRPTQPRLRGNSSSRARVVTHMSMGFSLPFGLGSQPDDAVDDEVPISVVVFPTDEDQTGCADDSTLVRGPSHHLDRPNSACEDAPRATLPPVESLHVEVASTSAVVPNFGGRWAALRPPEVYGARGTDSLRTRCNASVVQLAAGQVRVPIRSIFPRFSWGGRRSSVLRSGNRVGSDQFMIVHTLLGTASNGRHTPAGVIHC